MGQGQGYRAGQRRVGDGELQGGREEHVPGLHPGHLQGALPALQLHSDIEAH